MDVRFLVMFLGKKRSSCKWFLRVKGRERIDLWGEREAYLLSAKRRLINLPPNNASPFVFLPLSLSYSRASVSSVLFRRGDQHCYGSASRLVFSFSVAPFSPLRESESPLFFLSLSFSASFIYISAKRRWKIDLHPSRSPESISQLQGDARYSGY